MIIICLRDGRNFLTDQILNAQGFKPLTWTEFAANQPHKITFTSESGHEWTFTSKSVRYIAELLWEQPAQEEK